MEDQEVRLGRNLAAAFIAACHGIGLDYARRKYADQPVGEYWIALARMVIADQNNRPAPPERTLSSSEAGGEPTDDQTWPTARSCDARWPHKSRPPSLISVTAVSREEPGLRHDPIPKLPPARLLAHLKANRIELALRRRAVLRLSSGLRGPTSTP